MLVVDMNSSTELFKDACRDNEFNLKSQNWQLGFSIGFAEGLEAAQKEQAAIIKDLLAENKELKAILHSYITYVKG